VTFERPFPIVGSDWLQPGTYELLIEEERTGDSGLETVFRIYLVQHDAQGRKKLRLLDPKALTRAMSPDPDGRGGPNTSNADASPLETSHDPASRSRPCGP